MVENMQKIDCIRSRLAGKMEDLGKNYFDEVTKYLITSELVAKTNSEVRLVNDISYLLTKVSLLERMYVAEVIALENTIDNKCHQTTIEESLSIEGDN